MIPKLSPLKLLDFAIINTDFKFVTPKGDVDIQKIVSDYESDIDFAIVDNPDGTRRVFIKVSINKVKSPMPGYSLYAEGIAVFDITLANDLNTEDRQSLLQYSAVSIALNSLRGFISALTAAGPFGRYILPSIDVNDLFAQKAKVVQSNKPNTERKKQIKKAK